MQRDEANRLLDRIGGLSHACDLDLLVFFARHPRTLVASEQLATWLGYELKQIAASLEVLLESGWLTRSQSPAHAARMYVFVTGGAGGGWLPSLLTVASTRAGRLAMREALATRAPKDTEGHSTARSHRGTAPSRPRPFVVRRPPDDISRTKTG